MAAGSPIFVLEQNLKSHKTSAQTCRLESEKALEKAAYHDDQVEIWQKAIDVLKAAEANAYVATIP